MLFEHHYFLYLLFHSFHHFSRSFFLILSLDYQNVVVFIGTLQFLDSLLQSRGFFLRFLELLRIAKLELPQLSQVVFAVLQQLLDLATQPFVLFAHLFKRVLQMSI